MFSFEYSYSYEDVLVSRNRFTPLPMHIIHIMDEYTWSGFVRAIHFVLVRVLQSTTPVLLYSDSCDGSTGLHAVRVYYGKKETPLLCRLILKLSMIPIMITSYIYISISQRLTVAWFAVGALVVFHMSPQFVLRGVCHNRYMY